MKKIVLITGLVLLAASFGLLGCAGTNSKTEETSAVTEPDSGSVDDTSNITAEVTSAAEPVSASFDGRWTSDGQSGPMPIYNGKIDGDKITFNVTINLNGQDIVVNYTGVLTGDKLKLTWPGQGGITQEVICSRE